MPGKEGMTMGRLVRFPAMVVLLTLCVAQLNCQTRAAPAGGQDRILFCRATQPQPRDDLEGLWTVSADGGERVCLTANGPTSCADGCWSPDGRSIAFDGDADVYVMDADGGDRERLAERAGFPAWSPDGGKVTFYKRQGGLAVINPDGTGLVTAHPTALPANYYPPVWSPDSREIAFAHSEAEGPQCIWVVGADGTGLRRLTDMSDCYYPSWSPDAQSIAFLQGILRPCLYCVEPAGTKPARLVTRDCMVVSLGRWLAWSPDGKRLLFQSQAGELCTISPAGEDLSQVTRLPGGKESPDWSPDGTRIVFANREGERERCRAWIVNADGTGLRELAEAAGATRVLWQPRAKAGGPAAPAAAPRGTAPQGQGVAALLEKAAAAKRDGDLKEAETLLRQALQVDPNSAQAHWLLAWVLVAKEDKAAAADELRKVIELAADPKMKQEAQAALDRMK
jgi:Tol biopolymer transport system component